MITKKQLLQTLDSIAPESNAEPWDNGGLQIFSGKNDIHTILTSLDVTEAVINEAINQQADWIVAHHPLFFKPIRSLDQDDPAGELIMRLIRHGISVYAAHTSFDSAPGGNNDYLADCLDLGLEREPAGDPVPPYLYISKTLEPSLSFERLCTALQTALKHNSGLTYAYAPIKPLRKIAICTGSGADCIMPAIRAGCDVLVTGDLKYHDALFAHQMKFCVIDAGHFHTEKLFAQNMSEKLQSALGNHVQVITTAVAEDPFACHTFK